MGQGRRARVTTNRYEVSFGDDENVLELVVMVDRFINVLKNH